MSSIIALYTYLLSVKNITDKINLVSYEDFINNEEIISASYAIFKQLIDYLVKLDEVFILHSELNILIKEIYEIDRLIVNNYKMINSMMLYDFFKVDYNRLVKIINELVK